ncbi:MULTISPECIES: UTRA domain-containing protein [Caballeronia]|uniref:UTRA domain-containing protein n=1 Tax=Caballeronia TaxID=1827195 RepID=UPI003857C596
MRDRAERAERRELHHELDEREQHFRNEIARRAVDAAHRNLRELRGGDEIQQDVRAIAVSAEMARRLRVEAGTAALEIVRRYLDASGATFEISVTVHPAERFSVSMRLKRSPG